MDRRKMLAMLGLSPALVAGSPAYTETARKAVPDSAVGDNLITVMNPGIPNKLATRYPLAPPLDNLDNKTIYMINLSWEGPDAGNYFYGAMREWLAQRYPGIKTTVKVTADGMFGLDPAILKEMTANKADGAIVGVAG
ncbi:MAG: hypothetical protein ABSG27_16520 [Candidatus Acidiferrales bacterium]